MDNVALRRSAAAEALGTGFLVATVVGSGIMAEKLAGGNAAIALLGNTIPTGAILVVLILALAPISGAHFNPAVSLVMAINGRLRRLGVGFCGGLTTFSALMVQSADRGRRVGTAYLASTVGLSLAACWLGFVLAS